MKTIKKLFRILVLTPFDFIQKYFKTCVFLFIVLVILSLNGGKQDFNANLAKIYIKGAILESETFKKQIEVIESYPNIRGILLVIDSPGGGLAASVEIADMVKELNTKLPVVAYVQGLMASGSYYAGMYAKSVVANRGSMIGSIGVIMGGYNAGELMDKIGVKPQMLSAGEYKTAAMTFWREWSENEKNYLQNILNQHYDMFVSDVSEARNLDKNNHKDFADGKIFNAYDAQKLGLIDLVGSQNQAINILQELSGVRNPVWVEKGAFEAYLEKISSKAVSEIISQFSVKLQ